MTETKAPMTLREVGQIHFEWLDEMRQLPKGTRTQQRAAYNTLAKWFEEEHGREAMTTDWTGGVLDLYFRKCISKHRAFDTKRQQTILAERWMMTHGYLPWGRPICEPRVPRRGYTPSPARDRRLTDEEVLRVAIAGGKRHARNYFLILFARLTGRRISEIVALKWVDVLWKDNDIKFVNLKAGSKRKMMPLTPEVRALLEEWKAVYAADLKAAGVPTNWYIFPATEPTGQAVRGQRRILRLCPMSPIGDSNDIINDALRDADLKAEPGDAWHLFRKSAVNRTKQDARRAGRADALELAQGMADHASSATTKTYIADDDDYQRSKEWHMEARQLDAETLSAIPFLANLVQTKSEAPTTESEVDALGADQVYTDHNVIDFTSRRRRQAVV